MDKHPVEPKKCTCTVNPFQYREYTWMDEISTGAGFCASTRTNLSSKLLGRFYPIRDLQVPMKPSILKPLFFQKCDVCDISQLTHPPTPQIWIPSIPASPPSAPTRFVSIR